VRAEEIDLKDVPGGCRLRVKVRAGARSDAILAPHAGALKLAVSAAPERGRANDAVAALLAGAAGLPPSAVTILSGHTSPSKTVLVRGVPAARLLARLNLHGR